MHSLLQLLNITSEASILNSAILCSPYMCGRRWEVKESDALHPPGIVHSLFRLYAVTIPLERGKTKAF
jgi:hypothetical protein